MESGIIWLFILVIVMAWVGEEKPRGEAIRGQLDDSGGDL